MIMGNSLPLHEQQIVFSAVVLGYTYSSCKSLIRNVPVNDQFADIYFNLNRIVLKGKVPPY